MRKTALREIRILKQLKHDHIVNLIEVFRDGGRIFLVFEQLNRTILEELESAGDNMGIDPLEVSFNYFMIIMLGVKDSVADTQSYCFYSFS